MLGSRLERNARAEGGCGNMINMLNGSDQTELAFAAMQNLACAMPRKHRRWRGRNRRGQFRRRQRGAVPMREFSRSLPMSLLRAREAVMRQFRASLRDHGLTEQQWRILRALASRRGHRGHGTGAGGLSARAEPVADFARPRNAPADRAPKVAKADLRRSMVSISPKGLRLMEAVAPTSEAIYAAITRRYGARKLGELQDDAARTGAKSGGASNKAGAIRGRRNRVRANLHDAVSARMAAVADQCLRRAVASSI